MSDPSQTTTEVLRKRIRLCTWIFIIGLLVSGVTAIPLKTELRFLSQMTQNWWFQPLPFSEGIDHWIQKVNAGIIATDAEYPFIFYGTDWLAFGHIVIATAFIGALIDPVRNIWLYQFGMISCVMVIPFALIFGHVREIPLGWRMIDCLFGIAGIIPVRLAYGWTKELETVSNGIRSEGQEEAPDQQGDDGD